MVRPPGTISNGSTTSIPVNPPGTFTGRVAGDESDDGSDDGNDRDDKD